MKSNSAIASKSAVAPTALPWGNARNMHGWQRFVGAIGGFAAVVGAIAWLIRTLFENMLKSSLADHQAQLDSASSIQIERFKADLANAAAEHKFRFEKLHEKRLEALADLHERWVNLGASLAFLQYQLDSRDRDPIQPETIQKSIDDLVQQYSDANRALPRSSALPEIRDHHVVTGEDAILPPVSLQFPAAVVSDLNFFRSLRRPGAASLFGSPPAAPS